MPFFSCAIFCWEIFDEQIKRGGSVGIGCSVRTSSLTLSFTGRGTHDASTSPSPCLLILLWQNWCEHDSDSLLKLLSQSCHHSGREAQGYVGSYSQLQKPLSSAGAGCRRFKVVEILWHLGSSPLHCRVSIRIIHFCIKETPASLWLRHEQV